jgi:hypothetical protein
VVRTGIGAEKRWLLAAALVVAMVVLLLLPSRFSIGPNWIVPAIEALLLVAIFIAERRPGDRSPAIVRGLSCALVFIHPGDRFARRPRTGHRPRGQHLQVVAGGESPRARSG